MFMVLDSLSVALFCGKFISVISYYFVTTYCFLFLYYIFVQIVFFLSGVFVQIVFLLSGVYIGSSFPTLPLR